MDTSNLSNVWFTSDLHLGHSMAAELRGFNNQIEHDWTIIANLNAVVQKKDKLFILGDVAWSSAGLKLVGEIKGTKELVIGNHDKHTTKEYLKYFTKIHGFRGYKNFWLSHCPIHPQEIFRKKGNIHGHIHNGAATKDIGYPYFNVNTDMNKLCPVNFTTIERWFERHGEENTPV